MSEDLTFRVIITGARKTNNYENKFVKQKMDKLLSRLPSEYKLVVVHGKCPSGGVDLTAEVWATKTDRVVNEPHPAEWSRFGASAGPKRNSHMVGLGADLVLAFPTHGSRGTWDCLQKAVNAGIKPRIYPLNVYVPNTHGGSR